MNTAELEGRVRGTLAMQASALEPPDVRPDDAVVVVGPAASDRRPRRRLLLAAAAALVVVSGAAVAARHDDNTVEPGSPGGSAFRGTTQTVALDAASLEVDANGHTFVPPADVSVEGDPGTFNEYTTLELTWQQNGTEMRVNMYFASDGRDWWATELRTYDGKPDGEWITMTGEFFRTPLGSAYHGDFDQQSLHIHGMTLQAFLRPAACGDTTQPIAPESGYSKIDGRSGGGFGVNVTLFDTATCTPVDVDGYDVSVTSDDGTIVTGAPSGYDVGTQMVNVQLRLLAPGTTTLHIAVTDKSTGRLLGQVDIPVHLT